MNILIVDGNEKNASDKYSECGMSTQYDLYRKVLENLLNNELNIEIIHPAHSETYLTKGISIDDFHGIVWTGSLLNIYDLGSPIERQIELAKELFKKKNKIFGSCWGLQVLNTAAGGNVRKNPKGLEAVIAKNITLNKSGLKHKMYDGKSKIFDSFCWHYDEIDKLASNAEVLSSNDKSLIQAISFSRGESEVWAVQYHPEFNPKWISDLMLQRKSLLLEEGIFDSSNEFNNLYNCLSDIKNFNHFKKNLDISGSIIEEKIHNLELFNWLENVKNDILLKI